MHMKERKTQLCYVLQTRAESRILFHVLSKPSVVVYVIVQVGNSDAASPVTFTFWHEKVALPLGNLVEIFSLLN
jgi:hypothetical protein